MIQDIAPHIYHNEYRPALPAADSFLLYFEGEQVLAGCQKDALAFPRFQELPGTKRELSSELIYLFSIDNCSFYLSRQCPSFDPEHFQMKSIRIFRDTCPGWLSFAGITAHQLYQWYDSRRFCGHCKKPLVHSGKERMVYCPDCGIMEYPKVSPISAKPAIRA